MSDKRDGGPAFPHWDVAFGPDGSGRHILTGGMSLRDYFAAKALPWCLSEFAGNAEDQPQYAETAYQIADALLAEREKQP